MKKNAKIISICMEKGGVGKTSLTVNIATGLAEIRKKRVLLIDLDPQHNASSILFYRRDHELATMHSPTIYDILTSEDNEFDEKEDKKSSFISISDAIVQTPIKNLDIIPANLKLSFAERHLRRPLEQEKILKNLLYEDKKNILTNYDYIFIDNSPSLGLLTINSLVACDYVLIPTTCEHLSILGLDLLFKSIKPIKKNINPSLEILGIVMNFFRKDWRVCIDGEATLKQLYSKYIFNAYIRQNSKLREAPGIYQTIFEFDPTCRGAEDIIKVMNEILEKLEDVSFKNNISSTKKEIVNTITI